MLEFISYNYDATWKDLLTFYRDGRIYYDSIGNPTQYYNSATFEWAKGRQLQRVQLADGTYLSFRYNDEGVRTRKTVNGVETYFYLDGTNILAQKTGSDILWFNYDANGTRISITMPNGAVYYYAYNAQGDVIGLYSVNQYGYFVPQVYYTYDAWGKVLSITGNMADTLGQQNPFRYRGYYYDSETQFYYLNSRYYDPEVGRFINADGQLTTGSDLSGMNLFAYCGNNPVIRTDSTGEAWWHWALAGLVVVGCAVATVATAGGFAAAAGAITAVGSGMAAATTASTVAASAFIGAATTFGTAVLTAAVTSNSVDEFNAQGNWGTVISTAGGAVLSGTIGYAMSKIQNSQIAKDDKLFLPNSFYSKHAPKQSTPNSSYTNYLYNDYTGKYEKSTAYYDFAGRQTIRIDWTNHGYSNHGNPHVHYTTYNSQYRDGTTIRWD